MQNVQPQDNALTDQFEVSVDGDDVSGSIPKHLKKILFADLDDVNQAEVDKIISSVDVQDPEQALYVGQEISDRITAESLRISTGRRFDRLQTISNKISESLKVERNDHIQDDLAEIIDFTKRHATSFTDTFLCVVRGEQYRKELEARKREEAQAKRSELKQGLRHYITSHQSRVSTFREYEHELPSVDKYIAELEEQNEKNYDAIRVCIAATQQMILDFDQNKGRLQNELSDKDYKKRKEFAENLDKRMLVLTKEYAVVVQNKSLLQSFRNNVTQTQSTLTSLLDKEMPLIERRLKVAGQAFHLLERHDQYAEYQLRIDGLEDEIKTCMKHHHKATSEDSPQADRFARQLGMLNDRLQETAKDMGAVEDELKDRSEALRVLNTNTVTTEAVALAADDMTVNIDIADPKQAREQVLARQRSWFSKLTGHTGPK